LLYYILFTSFFIYLLLFCYPNKYSQAITIQENWGWDKKVELGMSPDDRTKSNPEKIWNGYKMGHIFLFGNNKIIESEEELLEIPPFGKGYFRYKKIGAGVSYFSRGGELLWKKPYQSYPFSSYTGEIIFLVSGDGNQVIIIDENGNRVGLEQADGRFLADMAYTMNDGYLLVFSGGEIYRLSHEGKLIYKKNYDSQKEITFFKSAALSPDGKFSVIHYQKGDNDFVSIFDLLGNKITEIKLDKVYPHRIFLGLTDSATLALNLKDVLLIYNIDGKLMHRTQKKKNEVYQPVIGLSNLLIASVDSTILFLDEKGNVIKFRNAGKSPIRFLPSTNKNQVFIETQDELLSVNKFSN
jgi:hypothetical protein